MKLVVKATPDTFLVGVMTSYAVLFTDCCPSEKSATVTVRVRSPRLAACVHCHCQTARRRTPPKTFPRSMDCDFTLLTQELNRWLERGLGSGCHFIHFKMTIKFLLGRFNCDE